MNSGLTYETRRAGAVLTALTALVAGMFAISTNSRAGEGDGNWANEMINRSAAVSAGQTVRGNRTGGNRQARRQRQEYSTMASSDDRPSRRPSITGGGSVRWVASAGCLNGSLRSVVSGLAASYGPLTVSSTCRSAGHNRRVGGAPRSMHLSGDAVDFRIHQNVSAAFAALRSHGSVGGLKHYGGGLFHIDTGSRRSW